jgi:hypothetical protein
LAASLKAPKETKGRISREEAVEKILDENGIREYEYQNHDESYQAEN